MASFNLSLFSCLLVRYRFGHYVLNLDINHLQKSSGYVLVLHWFIRTKQATDRR